MTDDIYTKFAKEQISFYCDLLIDNEEWIAYHLKRRNELKEALLKYESDLKTHINALEE